MDAEVERSDRAAGLELRAAPVQIRCNAGGAAIALLGGLREQPQDHARDLRRNAVPHLVRRTWLSRAMLVLQLEEVLGLERWRAGQQLVEDGAHGVEVAAMVSGRTRGKLIACEVFPVRFAGLDIGELGKGREAAVGEPDGARLRAPEDALRRERSVASSERVDAVEIPRALGTDLERIEQLRRRARFRRAERHAGEPRC